MNKPSRILRKKLQENRSLDNSYKSEYHVNEANGSGLSGGAFSLGERHARELHAMMGDGMSGGFSLGDFKDGFKKAWNGYRAVTKTIAPAVEILGSMAGPKGQMLSKAFLTGDKIADYADGPINGLGKQKQEKKRREPNDLMKRRGNKVKEIMESKDLSFIDASKYIKNNKIPY